MLYSQTVGWRRRGWYLKEMNPPRLTRGLGRCHFFSAECRVITSPSCGVKQQCWPLRQAEELVGGGGTGLEEGQESLRDVFTTAWKSRATLALSHETKTSLCLICPTFPRTQQPQSTACRSAWTVEGQLWHLPIIPTLQVAEAGGS